MRKPSRVNYHDGRPVHAGDIVELKDGAVGTVLGVIDDDDFVSSLEKDQWSYLERGIVIAFDKYGVIRYPDKLDEDVVLVKRAKLNPKTP